MVKGCGIGDLGFDAGEFGGRANPESRIPNPDSEGARE